LCEAGQHPFGGLQFSELLGQFRPVAVELRQPLGEKLTFFCDVVEGGHLLSLSGLANRGHSFCVRRIIGYCAMSYLATASRFSRVQHAITAGESRLGAAGRLVIRHSGTEPVIRSMAQGDGLVASVIEKIGEAILGGVVIDARGLVSLDVKAVGTAANPTFTGSFGTQRFFYNGKSIPEVHGVLSYANQTLSGRADAMLEAAIEAGAEDVVSGEGGHEIYAAAGSLAAVAKALEHKFGEPRKAALVWKPQNTVAINDEQGEKLLRLIETLNEHDDVQNVYANFEVSDDALAKFAA
jgi:hypothetical protein